MHEKSLVPVNRESLAELNNSSLDRSDHVVVVYVIKDVAHPARQRSTFLLSKPSPGNRWGTDPKTARNKGRSRIIGNSILIDCNVGPSESGICRLSGNAFVH